MAPFFCNENDEGGEFLMFFCVFIYLTIVVCLTISTVS